jgi:threonine dehydratase
MTDLVAPAPHLERAQDLDTDTHAVWLQREDLGPLGAFKWRGAQAHCASLVANGERGVVAASTGNFAAAVALAASDHELEAHVVVPRSVSAAKLARIRSHGATVHLAGLDLHDAVTAARALASDNGLHYFEDGGSEAQLRGVSALGRELATSDAASVVVPLACGALAAGVAQGLRQAGSTAAVVGVQVRPCSRFAARWHGHAEPEFRPQDTIADGLADDRIVDPAFAVCKAMLADVLVVEEAAIRAAVRELHVRSNVLAEGAGAAALAGVRAHPGAVPAGKTVLIVSGANIDVSLARELVGDQPADAS